MSDLDDMERRIKEIFDRAGRELKAKWEVWLKDIDTELEGLQKTYEAAKASGDAAATRKAGIALSKAKKTKIMGNQYYDKMVKQAAARLQEANEQAMAYINGRMPKVYASSFNGSTTQIANDLPHNIGVSFDLVDENTVARLMRDPTLDLHDLQGGINGPKMAAWNNRVISGEILQGIVTGDSIPMIAGRLMNVAGMDMKAATRTARTMTTGAENAGREDSYLRAQDMGIAIHQKWIAALDGRTRHSHRQLDGEVQEVGEPFSNGLRFPGDPEGPPAEICNCRCTLIAMLDGFDREKVDRWNKLEGQSYEEWKQGGKRKRKDGKPEQPKEPENTPVFVDAKTKEEAEAYALKFADSVNYNGITLDNCNEINKALEELTSKYPIKKLDIIKQKRMAPIATANCRELNINGSKIGKAYDNSVADDVKTYKEQIDAIKARYPHRIPPDMQRKIDILEKKVSQYYSRWSVCGDYGIRGTVAHEYGHIIADQYFGQINYGRADAILQGMDATTMANKVEGVFSQAKKTGDIYSLSKYGAHNSHEFFAESFCAYDRGEKLPDYIEQMVKDVIAIGKL